MEKITLCLEAQSKGWWREIRTFNP